MRKSARLTRSAFAHTQSHFFSQKSRNLIFSCRCFDQRKKTFFSRISFFSKILKILQRLDKGNA